MRKRNVMQKKETDLCPLFQETCKKDECMWYHQQFGKCHIEIVGYNLFVLSKSVEKIVAS